MHRKLRPCLALSLIAAATTTGCQQEPPPPPPPPSVTVTTPTITDVISYREFNGSLKAVERVEIRARVGGYLSAIHFEPSARIKKGDLLFEIEHESYELEVQAAKARVAQAKATIKETQSIYNKIKIAFDKDAATQAEVIESEAQLERAKADLLAAESQLHDAELDLSYTYVRSPIDGVVDRAYVDPGNLVGKGESTLLTKVVQLDPIEAAFNVGEGALLEILGQRRVTGEAKRPKRRPLELALASDPDGVYPFKGHMFYGDSEVDESTRTIEVRATFENPKHALLPGLFAKLRAPGETLEDAVLVHENAIGTGLEGKYLLLVGSDNKVERRPVALGPRHGKLRVILEGLTPDERYIIKGLQRARPGRTVTPTQSAPPAAETDSDADTDG